LDLVDVPDFTQSPALPAAWYAGSSQPSISSSHIHHLVEHCVLSVFRIPALALRSRGRSASVARARQVAMYLAHVAFGLSLTEVGRLFSRDRTTVAHGCSVIEALRDDPDMDRALDVMERAVAPPRTVTPNPDA
jgi:chromosomal replication initiation ATPase DnaA